MNEKKEGLVSVLGDMIENNPRGTEYRFFQIYYLKKLNQFFEEVWNGEVKKYNQGGN